MRKRRPNKMEARVYSVEGTYTGVLGEHPGRCACKKPQRWPIKSPFTPFVRTCYGCKRWFGPAHYPAWYGKSPRVIFPELVTVNP
jgi:hypothetical protein